MTRALPNLIAWAALTLALACANPLEPEPRELASEPWVQTIPNANHSELRLDDLEYRLSRLSPALHNGVLDCISEVAKLPATPDGLRHLNAQVIGCGETLSLQEGGGFSQSISALSAGAALVASSRIYEAGEAIRQTGDVTAGIELLTVIDSLAFKKEDSFFTWRAKAGLGELSADVYRAMDAQQTEQ